jgi:Tfp pilus assembly protein PilF
MAAPRSALSITLLLAVYGLLFVGVGAYVSQSRVTAQTSTDVSSSAPAETAQFVGSTSCAQCHPREHAEWQTSQHAAAIQEASDKTVLGRFDGSTFSHAGVTSTFYKKDNKFWVRTDGPDGNLADFEIRYTFGVSPLQQYLIEMPKGRLQALGIAWDARPKEAGGQRWFPLYPDRKLAPGDPLHWTGIDQNWNYQCAFCHSTNLKKNYDDASGVFATSWSEISIGCEACHGPASHHVAWAAKTGDWQRLDGPGKGFAVSLDERKGVEWATTPSGTAARSEARKTSKEIETCAACHARRQQFSDDLTGTHKFLDAFRPALLEPGLYHADGQQHDEVYNYASFLESRMHAAGVTCSDCHNPHTLKLRALGNAVCAQCHSPATFDTAAHHHHSTGSKGAECAACHMPTTTYMVIDPRHDHSIRIPRPDRTYVLGTPNACNQCHSDKSPSWASEAIKSWYPSAKLGYQTFAEAFDLADRAAPGAPPALIKIVEDTSQSAIARASAVARLGGFPSAKSLAVIAQELKDADPIVRMAAVAALADTDPRVRLALLPPLLADEVRVVRMDAARALAGETEQHLSPEDRKRFENALDEYVAGQRFNAERPEAQLNLANLYLTRGQVSEAEAALLRAIEIDPTFVPAPITLAELRRSQAHESTAEEILRGALKRNPDAAPLLHALGLSLVRQKRTEEALGKLREAARLAPEQARFAYVAGVAMHDTGKTAEGIQLLQEALSHHPYDRDILYALATYDMQGAQYSSALQRAELLRELEPENQQYDQLLTTVRRLAR